MRGSASTAPEGLGLAAAGALGGVAAALWLWLLWTAAGFGFGFGSGVGVGVAQLADRVRRATLLGVAIPLVLGLLHLLYGSACFALALFCALAALRARSSSSSSPGSLAWSAQRPTWQLLVPVAAVLLVAWPQIVRPPLDGDTLAYHLPNALSWAQAHSLWATNTRYWWYPGGSELFAAGLAAVGARWSVPLAGVPAALMVALRVAAFGERRAGAQRAGAAVGAALVGAAFVAAPLAGFQAATLQNDLWLAFALLEVLWVLLYGGCAWWEAAAVIGICALIKPSGWIVALLAIAAVLAAAWLARRARGVAAAPAVGWPTIALGFSPIVLWALRDALLSSSAIIPISATSVPWVWQSTIAAHGLHGLLLLLRAVLRAGPVALCCALAVLAVAFSPRVLSALLSRNGERADGAARWHALALAGTLVFVLYVFSPFGFAGSVPQLAGSGASLRFALPGLACGAALLAVLARRYPLAVGVLAGLAAVFGVVRVLATFANDLVTWTTLPVVILTALLLSLGLYGAGGLRAASAARASMVSVAFGAFAAAMLAWAGSVAAARAVGFYDAGMRAIPSGQPTRLFAALASLQPPAAVALDVRAGAIGMVSPHTLVYDDLDAAPCAMARRLGAVLVVGTDPDVPSALRAARRRLALTDCGHVLYRDPAAVVASPFP